MWRHGPTSVSIITYSGSFYNFNFFFFFWCVAQHISQLFQHKQDLNQTNELNHSATTGTCAGAESGVWPLERSMSTDWRLSLETGHLKRVIKPAMTTMQHRSPWNISVWTRTPHRRFCNLVAKQDLFEHKCLIMIIMITNKQTNKKTALLPRVMTANVQETLVPYRQRCADGSGWALEWCWRGTSQQGRMWHCQFRPVWSGNVSHREFSHHLSCRK